MLYDENLQQKQHKKLEVPILFIIFNRPESTKKVFEAIRKAKPTKLFIAADAPRYPLKNEYELCEQARTIIQQIDWNCDVKTFFQESNLGVGRGGMEGINWFFQHVEAGIILEDDCVPLDDFFTFCAEGLQRFQDDSSVMMLAGTNYLMGEHSTIQGYYKSSFYAIWGWATWRRAWRLYSYDLSAWGSSITYKELKKFFGNKLIAQRWATMFDDIKTKHLEAWDIQWVFACVKNSGHCLSIPYNLISNIGIVGGHSNGNKAWVHEMPYQKTDVINCLKRELSQAQTKALDLQVYASHGFLYQEPKYRRAGRFILEKIPLAKTAYKQLKLFLTSN